MNRFGGGWSTTTVDAKLFSDLENLEILSLSNNSLQTSHLLSDLTNLTDLTICATSTEGLGGNFPIAALKKLRRLDLSYSSQMIQDTKAFAEQLQQLTNLEVLLLGKSKANDDIVDALPSLVMLRELELSGTDITPDCIPVLGQLKHLRYLGVKGMADYCSFVNLHSMLPDTIVTL